jgi:hypothetical protein
MRTHSLYPDGWLINGVIRQDEIAQARCSETTDPP